MNTLRAVSAHIWGASRLAAFALVFTLPYVLAAAVGTVWEGLRAGWKDAKGTTE